MENSILTSTKKILGIAEEYTIFDLDIITHINSAFLTLTDLGMGPSSGFMITDADSTWDQFLQGDNRVNAAKTYVYLRVRMVFDPPTTSYVKDAFEAQLRELEWRINVRQEATDYVDPNSSDNWHIDGMANPILIQAGIDWWLSFTYKDSDGTPVPVTDLAMEMRAGRDQHGAVLYSTEGSTPSLVVDYSHSPTITVHLPGDATANKDRVEAWFDAYARDPDGNRVQLSAPRLVSIRSNVSAL